MDKITRREFLTKSLPKIGMGALGMALGVDVYTKREEILETIQRKRIIDVSAEGHLFHCVFWKHGNETLGVGHDDITERDLNPSMPLMLETGDGPYLEIFSKDNQSVPGGVVLIYDYEQLDKSNALHKPVTLMGDNGRDIVFCDLRLDFLDIVAGEVPGIASIAAGAGLTHKNLGRRKFLSALGLGMVGWGLSGAVATAHPSIGSFQEDIAKQIDKFDFFVELTHPETVRSGFRNAIIAYKLLDLNIDCNLIMGKLHATLPFYLQAGKENLKKYLEMYPKFFSDKLVPDKEYLYTSAVCSKSSDGSWSQRAVIHQDLKEIFN